MRAVSPGVARGLGGSSRLGRSRWSSLAALAAAALLAMPLAAVGPAAAGTTLTVGPGGYSTIQAAVNAAQKGDTILIMPGVYQEDVTVAKADLVITGTARDDVILEGGGLLNNGLTVIADGVTVKSMTAQNYVGNGFVFSSVDDYLMTDLRAANNGEYGLYAIHSQRGVISHSIAYGHGDSGFYIGETPHCDCDVMYNIGFNNMLGYSGTANSYVRIHHNEFYDNRAGILPNVLPQEMGVEDDGTFYGTQVHTEIYENYVHDNNNMDAPETGLWETVHVPAGMGIAIGGGWFNEIHSNRIENNRLMGIGLFWLFVPPRANHVHDNDISGGRYGIWWDEWGEDHCFADNRIVDVETESDPAPLPSCPGLVPELVECPAALADWVSCGASDARPPNLLKDVWLAHRAINNLPPEQDW